MINLVEKMEKSEIKNHELLSPAGSYQAFLAALNAGADAIYAAGSRFGARAYAENFTENELLRAIDLCHLQNKKLYMTVNTLCKEKEIADFVNFITPFYREGLHGVIVQDIGVISILREMFPDLPVHASTQMTITSYEGADYLKNLGVCRVVPARELSLGEIRDIHDRTGLEIESFIHGAMCYSYSGQCLFSSFLGGRSGNRGRCAQPCRQPYCYDGIDINAFGLKNCNDKGTINGRFNKNSIIKKTKTAGKKKCADKYDNEIYPLSMKDLCTVDIIPDIIDAGVCSFKIEGRMKQPQYVRKVTSVYRKYIDLYLENGREGYKVSDSDREVLASAGYRSGFMNGYYKRHNGRCLITMDKPGYTADGGKEETYREPEYLVNASVKLISGSKAEISFNCDGDNTVFTSEILCEAAKNQPLSDENIKKQLLKAGDGCVRIDESLNIKTSGDVFIPVSALNELRRQGLNYFQKTILQKYKREINIFDDNRQEASYIKCDRPTNEEMKNPGMFISVLCENYEQYIETASTLSVRRIYIETELFDELCTSDYEQLIKHGKSVYLALPYIFRDKSRITVNDILKKHDSVLKKCIKGFLVRNYEELNYCINNYSNMSFVCDYSLYSFNSMSAVHFLNSGAECVTLPLELNLHEMADRGYLEKSELVVFGRIPLMLSAGCIVNTYGGCQKDRGRNIYLRDRFGTVFPVIRECKYCYNRILNSVPLNLMMEKSIGRSFTPAYVRIILSVEDKKESREILDMAESVYGGVELDTVKWNNNSYTKGHYRKGVE